MRHALRLPTFLTLLLATAAVNKHEDPHEHAAALKKREVNSRHADAGKKQVKMSEPYHVTDDMEQDFRTVHNFFKGVKGKVPELSF